MQQNLRGCSIKLCQIIITKISDDDLKNWIISDYLYHHFGLKITDTMTVDPV